MGKVQKDKMFSCQSQSKGHWIDRSVILQVLSLKRRPNPIEKTLTSNKIVLLLSPFSEARWSFDPWCQGGPGAHSCQRRPGFSLGSTVHTKCKDKLWKVFGQTKRASCVFFSISLFFCSSFCLSSSTCDQKLDPIWDRAFMKVNNIRLVYASLKIILVKTVMKASPWMLHKNAYLLLLLLFSPSPLPPFLTFYSHRSDQDSQSVGVLVTWRCTLQGGCYLLIGALSTCSQDALRIYGNKILILLSISNISKDSGHEQYSVTVWSVPIKELGDL